VIAAGRGIENAIYAVENVENTCLLILGNGEKSYIALLEKMISSLRLEQKVFFLGARNDVPEILTQLDSFIYSTEHDTFGIAVVEAIMAGVPVFVNDLEVMKEITANGEYATLYKTKDEKDLVREFMLFLQNREAYILKTKKSAQLVRNRYSIDMHIENLKNIYSSIH
jgi:glycosyltransferase involved in cell wall biosynthesis